MRKTVLVLLVAVFAIAVPATLSILRVQGQKSSPPGEEVATPVQEGVLSERQREHSKLYGGYKGARKLSELVKQQEGRADEGLTITRVPGPPELALNGERAAEPDILNRAAAEADAVVIGVVRDKTSQMTADGTFVFTDYDLSVEEVLKDNDAARIQPGGGLVVTRPGGKISINGHIVTAEDKSFKRLAPGGRYLLFLRYIPATGAYRAVNDKASFELDGNRVAILNEAEDTGFTSDRDAASFINEVGAAIGANLRGRKGVKSND